MIASARVEERCPDLDWAALDRLFGALLGAIVGVAGILPGFQAPPALVRYDASS